MATLSPLPPLSQFHPRCKVCEYGDLVPKKIFRMSGPVVAIGFILLVPSVLGMAMSALMFFGVTGITGSEPAKVIREDSDTTFRRTCFNTSSASPVGVTTVELCECILNEYKTSNSTNYANDVCAQRFQHGTLQQSINKLSVFTTTF